MAIEYIVIRLPIHDARLTAAFAVSPGTSPSSRQKLSEEEQRKGFHTFNLSSNIQTCIFSFFSKKTHRKI